MPLPFKYQCLFGLAHWIVHLKVVKDASPRREFLKTSGWHCACTLVFHDNDAFRGYRAFRDLECRRDRAIGKQSISTAQRHRKYLRYYDERPDRKWTNRPGNFSYCPELCRDKFVFAGPEGLIDISRLIFSISIDVSCRFSFLMIPALLIRDLNPISYCRFKYFNVYIF